MTAALPEPFTSAEVDLRDFPRMPFDVARLRRSKAWLLAKKSPELGFYMMNLWMASWHETPPGSLEDFDDGLMDFAICKERRWTEVRELVMRNWVKCSDGRLYHKTVAEMVDYAWQSKLQRRRDTSAATAAAKKKREAGRTEPPTIPGDDRGESAHGSVDGPSTDRHGPSTESDTATNRREGNGREENGREGKGRDSVPEANASAVPAVPKSAAEMTKQELWSSGKSLLSQQGMPAKQCGTFVGKLVADYGEAIVVNAVRLAVVEQPADAAAYLKKICKSSGPGGRQATLSDADRQAQNDRNNAEALKALGAVDGEVIDV